MTSVERQQTNKHTNTHIHKYTYRVKTEETFFFTAKFFIVCFSFSISLKVKKTVSNIFNYPSMINISKKAWKRRVFLNTLYKEMLHSANSAANSVATRFRRESWPELTANDYLGSITNEAELHAHVYIGYTICVWWRLDSSVIALDFIQTINFPWPQLYSSSSLPTTCGCPRYQLIVRVSGSPIY